MDVCPVCHRQMTAVVWGNALPPIDLGDGRLSPAIPGGVVAGVCPDCSLIALPPGVLDVPPQLDGNDSRCPSCGRKMSRGSFLGRIPDFLTSYGGKGGFSVEGPPQCALCGSCGLIRLLFKRMHVQSPESVALEKWIQDKATAERIIRRWIVLGALALGLPIPLLVALWCIAGWAEAGTAGLGIAAAVGGVTAVPIIITSAVASAGLGALLGALLAASIVKRSGLPRPWIARRPADGIHDALDSGKGAATGAVQKTDPAGEEE